MTELKVSKCTESKNGGYVLTLKEKAPAQLVATPFGNTNKSETLNTFYMKVEGELEVGFTASIDLNDYQVVVRDFTTDEGKELELKWLHVK